jgi:hypothetical protein
VRQRARRATVLREWSEFAAAFPTVELAALRSPCFDPLVKRVFHCPESSMAVSVRKIDPRATLLHDWSEFAAAFPNADVNVLVRGPGAGPDLPDRLSEVARSHPLPSVIVVAHFDLEHLLRFRRTRVDEFVHMASMARDLPAALVRSVIDPLRERLALHVEGLEHWRPALRAALVRVLREPGGIRTVEQLAAAERVTPRTLEKQWKALRAGAQGMRLQDLLWMIRLLEALGRRRKGTSLDGISEELKVDLRSLRRASRRYLVKPLGCVSAVEAGVELLRLRRRILGRLGGLATRRS